MGARRRRVRVGRAGGARRGGALRAALGHRRHHPRHERALARRAAGRGHRRAAPRPGRPPSGAQRASSAGRTCRSRRRCSTTCRAGPERRSALPRRARRHRRGAGARRLGEPRRAVRLRDLRHRRPRQRLLPRPLPRRAGGARGRRRARADDGGRAHDPRSSARCPRTSASSGWVPHAELLPHCAAMVCHGGSGTVRQGLAAGVPLVVLPLFADQPENARLVHGVGAGIALQLHGSARATVDDALACLDRLPGAVRAVLTGPGVPRRRRAGRCRGRGAAADRRRRAAAARARPGAARLHVAGLGLLRTGRGSAGVADAPAAPTGSTRPACARRCRCRTSRRGRRPPRRAARRASRPRSGCGTGSRCRATAR